MAKVTPNFKLKNTTAGKTSLIIMKVYYRTKRYVYSTGEKILPQHWDDKSGRVDLSGISHPQKKDYKDINFILSRLETEAIKAFDHFSTQNHIPDADEFKEVMDFNLNKKPKPEPPKEPDFFSFSEEFIEQSKVTKVTSVIKAYHDTLGKLRNFEKEIHYPIKFSSIDLKFYYKFVKYLADRGCGVNTIGQKHIKNLKTFVHAADRRGYAINREIDFPEFKKLSEETDKIYLTRDDVNKLFELDLSDSPRLDRVRDSFLIGCNTALRYSDYSALQKEQMKDHGNIKILDARMDKGDRRVSIPLNGIVIKILEKYDYDLPRTLSNQNMNDYLKELGKRARLDEEVLITTYVGLERVDKKMKKYELITTHTARRTGATNLYLAGNPAQSIMKITGHKTETEFMKYIRINEFEHAIHIADNEFFRQHTI